MMVLYNKLFDSPNYDSVSVVGYLSSSVDQILTNFPSRDAVRIEENIDEFELDAGKLQPLGIILNELLTNIMKHAFTGRSDGVISVSAALSGNRVSIGCRQVSPDSMRASEKAKTPRSGAFEEFRRSEASLPRSGGAASRRTRPRQS